MQIDLQKIRDHAERRLTDVPRETAERLASFKRFLKIETERLRMRHRFGLGGREIAQGRSYLADVVVSRACQMAAADLGPDLKEDLSGCAIVALGGYGRRELAPHSDVDLLFLHPDRLSKAVAAFVEKALILLWDIGLAVGHSFRSVADCVTMARRDLHSRNAMSEARLVAGNGGLFQRFSAELQSAVYRNRRSSDAYMASMRAEMEERLARFGGAVCIQEPNVKESAGGLRDLHTVAWVGHARYGCRDVDQLLAGGFVSPAEHATARRAYDFIARVRNEAHFATSRRTDLLSLDLQPALASGLGYVAKRGIAASEIFMRDYYRRAQDLRRFCEAFLLRAAGPPSSSRRFALRPKAVGPRGRYEVRDGRLHLRAKGRDPLHGHALRILEVFEVAQEQGVRVGDELKLLVHQNLRQVDRRFRKSREESRAFLEMLRHPGRVAIAVRDMHETGFLGRYLPEFERIAFIVQHDFYHKYTVDEHTLKALEGLDRVANEGLEDVVPFAKVLEEVKDPARLSLGLLLHDIGKGHGGGHVPRGARIAEGVCGRLGLDAEASADVVFLVQKHLVMSQVSQRRDLSDEGLIEGFAETVSTLDRLNMLLLLTFADTNAVGPGVWSDWKGALLWELYSKTRAHFADDRTAAGDRRAHIEEKVVSRLLPEFLKSDVESYLALYPDRYLRASSPEAIARHFRMTRELVGGRSLVSDWRSASDARHTVLTVCARDASGLLARLAGTLTGHGLDILGVDAFTRSDGLILDTFKACEAGGQPVRGERWPVIEADLAAAVEGRHDVDAAVIRARERMGRRPRRRPAGSPAVTFDAGASPLSTVIDVRADDEPGLVYKIARTLAQLGLSISLAKIATEKSQALDVFYVTNADGQTLSAEEQRRVEAGLLMALGGNERSSS